MLVVLMIMVRERSLFFSSLGRRDWKCADSENEAQDTHHELGADRNTGPMLNVLRRIALGRWKMRTFLEQ